MKQYFADKMFPIKDFPFCITHRLQGTQMTPHTHDFIELVFVTEGHTTHKVNFEDENYTYGLIQGDCFAIMPGDIHAYTNSKNFVIYNVAFQPEILASEIQELEKMSCWENLFGKETFPLRKRFHLTPHKRLKAENFLRKMMIEYTCRSPGYQFRIKLALFETFCVIDEANVVDWHPYDNEPYSGIMKTLDFMEQAESTPFKLNELARTAGMSVSSYTKKFRDMTGQSPCEYFIGIKLEKIRSELFSTDLSITELAYKYGFCDTSYMIRMFRRRHGSTPQAYRNIIMSKQKNKSGM